MPREVREQAAPAATAPEDVERVLRALDRTREQLGRTQRTLDLFVAAITGLPARERPAAPLPTPERVAAVDARRAEEERAVAERAAVAATGSAGSESSPPAALAAHVLGRPTAPAVPVGAVPAPDRDDAFSRAA